MILLEIPWRFCVSVATGCAATLFCVFLAYFTAIVFRGLSHHDAWFLVTSNQFVSSVIRIGSVGIIGLFVVTLIPVFLVVVRGDKQQVSERAGSEEDRKARAVKKLKVLFFILPVLFVGALLLHQCASRSHEKPNVESVVPAR